MASITLRNVTKVYPGAVKAVDDFSLEIEDKEFVIFVGPSGCGKSTTLRMIAGLEEITGGEIYIGDTLVNEVQPKDRNIAMVFQSYALYRHMTVYKNMAFSLKLRKTPKDEIDRKVREAAAILGIEHLLDRKPRALSGGESQRAALGRAMVRDPSVFLLDEPLSNLDAKLRSNMRTELIKLHKRLATTFIYVTHDQTEAMTMGDRIVIMDKGVIQQVDTPQRIYDHPANLFVAGFIGSPQMNFLTVEVKRDAAGYFVDLHRARISLDECLAPPALLEPYVGKELVLGVRPEDIALLRAEDGQTNLVRGLEVELSEMLGAETYLHLICNGGKLVARIPQSVFTRPGERMDVRLAPSKLHLFDPETGAAVTAGPAARTEAAV